jgi:hypothetical protein
VAEGLRDAILIVESDKLEYKRGTPLMKGARLRTVRAISATASRIFPL